MPQRTPSQTARSPWRISRNREFLECLCVTTGHGRLATFGVVGIMDGMGKACASGIRCGGNVEWAVGRGRVGVEGLPLCLCAIAGHLVLWAGREMATICHDHGLPWWGLAMGGKVGLGW